MNENNKTSPAAGESLSALMDGEAADLEFHRLLRDMPADDNLRARWARYHLTSSILQKQHLSPVGSLRLADAVQAAIKDDVPVPTHAATTGGSGHAAGSWLAQVTRLAVAASVALSVIVGAQWKQQYSAAAAPAQVAASVETTGSLQSGRPEILAQPAPAMLVSQPLTAAMPQQQGRDARYDRYMQNYLEHAPVDPRRSVMLPVGTSVQEGR